MAAPSGQGWEKYFSAIRSQDWKSARDALRALAAVEPGNAGLFLKLGDIYQRLKEPELAIPAYHQSARLLRNEGFLHKAVALYKIILRLDPYDAQGIEQSKELLMELETAKSGKKGLGQPAAPEESVEEFAAALNAKASTNAEVPDLFSCIPEKDAKEILSGLDSRTFRDGQAAISEGETGDSIFIVVSGRARVVATLLGKQIELAVLSQGDVFGEVGFLTGRPRTASVIAAGSLEALEMTREQLNRIIDAHPSILPVLEGFQENRARDTVRRIQDVL